MGLPRKDPAPSRPGSGRPGGRDPGPVRHHPSRKDATMPDSPPPDLTYEAGSAFVRAAGLVVDTVTATEAAGTSKSARTITRPGASCTAACIPPRSSQPPASARAPPSVTAANSRSGSQRHELPSTGDCWPAGRHGFPGSAGTHAAALECQGRAGGRRGRRRRPGASPERAITSRWPQRPIKRVAASHLLGVGSGPRELVCHVDGARRRISVRVPGNGLWPGQKRGTPRSKSPASSNCRAHTVAPAATASTTREGFYRPMPASRAAPWRYCAVAFGWR